ncbi:MAG: flagellar hook-basal body complex protein [Buchnera aphidicola (Schlechtendalia peitan)]
MKPEIYIAMMSAQKILDNQGILANNLANASTIGFKSELLSRSIVSDNKNYEQNTYLSHAQYDQTQGLFKHTMQPLDFSIKDENGWLMVTRENNSIAYTKNGHLKINEKRQLTSQNNIVMGERGPIIIPKYSNIRILSDGTIKIIQDNAKIDKKLDKIKLVNIDIKDLLYSDSGLYCTNNKTIVDSILKNHYNVKIIPETLEDSNVNLSENIVNMISDARKFDIQMKLLSHYDENAQLINKFLNINN